ncbi:MAG: hypothetical protein L0346_08795, partial [Chloroflexi bacterium]|nr:hypothetical protein [Chloroflexota bacterium]
YRAWATLQQEEAEGLPGRWPQTAEDYLQYCLVCRRLAAQANLSLRELDRALWAKSWENDLRQFVADGRN